MKYLVRIDRRAMKKLVRIPEPYYTHLKAAIMELGNEPRPQGCKKLRGRNGYRIRVADYRIIYEIKDSLFIVDVVDLGNRKDIY